MSVLALSVGGDIEDSYVRFSTINVFFHTPIIFNLMGHSKVALVIILTLFVLDNKTLADVVTGGVTFHNNNNYPASHRPNFMYDPTILSDNNNGAWYDASKYVTLFSLFGVDQSHNFFSGYVDSFPYSYKYLRLESTRRQKMRFKVTAAAHSVNNIQSVSIGTNTYSQILDIHTLPGLEQDITLYNDVLRHVLVQGNSEGTSYSVSLRISVGGISLTPQITFYMTDPTVDFVPSYNIIPPTIGVAGAETLDPITIVEDDPILLGLVLPENAQFTGPYEYPGNWTLLFNVGMAETHLLDDTVITIGLGSIAYSINHVPGSDLFSVSMAKEDINAATVSILPSSQASSITCRLTAIRPGSATVYDFIANDRPVTVIGVNDPPNALYLGSPMTISAGLKDVPLGGSLVFTDEEVLADPSLQFEITLDASGWALLDVSIDTNEVFLTASKAEVVRFQSNPGRTSQVMSPNDILITPLPGIEGDYLLLATVSDLGGDPLPILTHRTHVNVSVIPNRPLFLTLSATEVSNQAHSVSNIVIEIQDEDASTLTVDVEVLFGTLLLVEEVVSGLTLLDGALDGTTSFFRIRGPLSVVQTALGTDSIYFRTSHNQTGINQLTVTAFDHGTGSGMNKTNTTSFLVYGQPTLDGTQIECWSPLGPATTTLVSDVITSCTLRPGSQGQDIWMSDDFSSFFSLTLDTTSLAAGASLSVPTYLSPDDQPPYFQFTLMSADLQHPAASTLTQTNVTLTTVLTEEATTLTFGYTLIKEARVSAPDISGSMSMTVPGQTNDVIFEPTRHYYIVNHSQTPAIEVVLSMFKTSSEPVQVQWNDEPPFLVDTSLESVLNLTLANGHHFQLQNRVESPKSDHRRQSSFANADDHLLTAPLSSEPHREEHTQNHLSLASSVGYNQLILTQLETEYVFNFDCPLGGQVLCALDIFRAGGPVLTEVDWVTQGGGHWNPLNTTRSIWIESYVTAWAVVPYVFGLTDSISMTIDGMGPVSIDNNSPSIAFPSPSPGATSLVVIDVQPTGGTQQTYVIHVTRESLASSTDLVSSDLSVISPVADSGSIAWTTNGGSFDGTLVTDWIANVTKTTTQVTLTLDYPLRMTSVVLNGGGLTDVSVDRTSPSPAITLGDRGTTTAIVATILAEDGVTTRESIFYVTRAGDSTVDTLADLLLKSSPSGTVLPWIQGVYVQDEDRRVWTASLPSTTEEVTITVDFEVDIQSVTLSGENLGSSVPLVQQVESVALTLGEIGSTVEWTLTVVAEDGHSEDYVLFLERQLETQTNVYGLPISFGDLSIDSEQRIVTSVSVPYTDHTWKDDPVFTSVLDHLTHLRYNVSQSHPVLLTYIDLSVDEGGTTLIPRNETDRGSCGSLSTDVSTVLNGQAIDQYLQSVMSQGDDWVNEDHAGQYLFDHLTYSTPDAFGWPIGGSEAILLENKLNLLTVTTGSETSLVVGLEPWTDSQDRHFLTYHIRLPLSELLACTATRSNVDGSHPAAVTTTSALDGSDNHVYTFFLTAVALEPVDLLGRRGTSRSVAHRMSVAVSPYGYVTQTSGSGRRLQASVADVAVLSGPSFGCSPDNDDGRVMIELDLFHRKDINQNTGEVLGIERLVDIIPQPDTVENENHDCYSFPVPDGSGSGLFATQSLDNWALISGRSHLDHDLTQILAGQRNCDPLVDPTCVLSGAPWCLSRNEEFCLQKVVLTTECLPLYTEGNTLERTDICYTQGSETENNEAGVFKIQFPITTCPSQVLWDNQINTDGNEPLCTHYAHAPETIRLRLTNVDMSLPGKTDLGRVRLESQLFSVPTASDFVVDGLSGTTDFTSVDAITMMNTFVGVPTFLSREYVTFVVRPVDPTLRERQPLAIIKITICRGNKGTLFARANQLMGSDAVSGPTCGGVSQQLEVLSNQAVNLACQSNQQFVSCLEAEYQPKAPDLAINPSDNGGLTGGAASTYAICDQQLGCDAFSIKMEYIETALADLSVDEVYFIETEVLLGQYYTEAGRRLLDVRNEPTSTTSISMVFRQTKSDQPDLSDAWPLPTHTPPNSSHPTHHPNNDVNLDLMTTIEHQLKALIDHAIDDNSGIEDDHFVLVTTTLVMTGTSVVGVLTMLLMLFIVK